MNLRKYTIVIFILLISINHTKIIGRKHIVNKETIKSYYLNEPNLSYFQSAFFLLSPTDKDISNKMAKILDLRIIPFESQMAIPEIISNRKKTFHKKRKAKPSFAQMSNKTIKNIKKKRNNNQKRIYIKNL